MAAKSHITPELFSFLVELSKNNNREWFKARKGRFEAANDGTLIERRWWRGCGNAAPPPR